MTTIRSSKRNDDSTRAAIAATSTDSKLTVSRPQLLVRGSDLPFRQFVHDTLAFATRINAVRDALGNAIGLSGTQYTILIAIAREQDKNDIGINEIAGHLHYSPAFVTIEVSKLVDAKLVDKKGNPRDRRRVLLTTTAKAERLLQELTTIQRPANDLLFETLTSDDFEVLRIKMAELVGSADRSLQLLNFTSMNEKSQRRAPFRRKSKQRSG